MDLILPAGEDWNASGERLRNTLSSFCFLSFLMYILFWVRRRVFNGCIVFQHAEKGQVRQTEIPILGCHGGALVVADPRAPVIDLREVERHLQGLTMGIPPLRREEVPSHLHRHTMGVPKNVNSLLRRLVHAMICYS
jgi:hypothetical protein